MQKGTVFLPAFICVFSLCVCGLEDADFVSWSKLQWMGMTRLVSPGLLIAPHVSSSLQSEFLTYCWGEDNAGLCCLGMGGCCSSLLKCLAGWCLPWSWENPKMSVPSMSVQLSDGWDEQDEFVFPAVDEKQRLELISLFVCVFRFAIYL